MTRIVREVSQNPLSEFQELTDSTSSTISSKRHLRRHSYNNSESSFFQTSRRQLRYARAEHSLSISFHAHVDAAPSENPTTHSLQIQLRLLNQAAILLTAQATDIKGRLDALSEGISKDRSIVDPEKYRQTLIERWKDQRSLEKIEDEVRRVQAVIENMSGNSSTSPVPVQKPESRAQVNLIKFLQSASFRPRSRHLRSRPRSSAASLIDRAPRRMTLADISPIRASLWSVTEAFTKEHVRLTTTGPATPETLNSLPVSMGPNRKQSLALCGTLGSIAEVGSVLAIQKDGKDVRPEDSTPSSATTSIFNHTEGTESMSGVETLVYAAEEYKVNEATRDSLSSLPTLSPVTTSFTDETSIFQSNGTATIFTYPLHQFNFDNVELEVEIPIYAQDLFASLDRIGLEFGKGDVLDSAFSITDTSTTPKQTKHSSLPPPAAFLTPPRRLSRSSGSLKGRISNLKPSVSLGNLHLNSNPHTKLPLERERPSLLSIPESSSMLSLSSSQTSLAPSRLEQTFPSLVVPSPPPGVGTETNTNVASGEGSDNSDSPRSNSNSNSKVTILKRKLSSRLSLAMFGSPTKTLKKDS
ncbi:hypothetical protein F5050DRAFT_1809034 [Lentinula boryana]|uniref:Uncharacterized protein n=1 Tax=Lentinula boryana TaxID=40481 RepID=A0ABQ8Q9B5_9AGAR|nr:hypothetical protein F5050DRAFT_1809034 [Lentinula boryana]